VSGYVLAGLVLGAILVLVHIARCRGARVTPRLERGVELILYGQAVAAGIRLSVLAATQKHFKPLSDEDRVYLVIGGLALIWVSVSSIAREFKQVPEKAAATSAEHQTAARIEAPPGP
jgi:hypothetical protein